MNVQISPEQASEAKSIELTKLASERTLEKMVMAAYHVYRADTLELVEREFAFWKRISRIHGIPEKQYKVNWDTLELEEPEEEQ